MGTLIALILIGVIGYFLYTFYQKQKNQTAEEEDEPRVKPYDKDDLRIENVEAGGMVQLKNVGPEMKDLEIQVIAKHTYRDGDDEWYELEGETTEGKVWLEYEEDDQLEVTLDMKKPKFSELSISKEDLEKIDEMEEGQVEYDGMTFYFEDSYWVTMLKYGDENQKKEYYNWDFETEDEKHFLSIEKWGKSDHEVIYSIPIDPDKITTLKLRAEKE